MRWWIVGWIAVSALSLDREAAATSCNDAIKNGLETDVDCGGNSCPFCALGRTCLSSSDCFSRICIGNVCLAPTCTDLVKNGDETDVDCGGSCAPCVPGCTCLSNPDCPSNWCVACHCQVPTCSDGITNGFETGVDCGGSCAPCADAAPPHDASTGSPPENDAAPAPLDASASGAGARDAAREAAAPPDGVAGGGGAAAAVGGSGGWESDPWTGGGPSVESSGGRAQTGGAAAVFGGAGGSPAAIAGQANDGGATPGSVTPSGADEQRSGYGTRTDASCGCDLAARGRTTEGALFTALGMLVFGVRRTTCRKERRRPRASSSRSPSRRP